jgi:hypothetical protein
LLRGQAEEPIGLEAASGWPPNAAKSGVLDLQSSGATARALTPQISLRFQQLGCIASCRWPFLCLEDQRHTRLVEPFPGRFLDFTAAELVLLVAADQAGQSIGIERLSVGGGGVLGCRVEV